MTGEAAKQKDIIISKDISPLVLDVSEILNHIAKEHRKAVNEITACHALIAKQQKAIDALETAVKKQKETDNGNERNETSTKFSEQNPGADIQPEKN